MIKRWLLILLLMLSCHALAQQAFEIITLRHRTVEQILPVVSPFVEQGGTITGMNDQIILRTSRKNLDEIKQLIATLDAPLRRLKVTVSNDISQESDKQDIGVSGRVRLGENAGARIKGHAYETTSTGNQHANQSIQVLEGSSGYIAVGQSLPVPLRQVTYGPGGVVVSETMIYRDIGSGFQVRPRVSGDTVTLEISPQNDTPEGRLGGANIQHLSTTVSGKLGAWMELGGSNTGGNARQRGYTSYSTKTRQDSRSVWLKVEEVK